MSRPTPKILKDLLPGLISILIFVFISGMYRMEAGIYAAVGFSFLALMFNYLKENVFPKFLLIDFSVLTFMGAVSIVSGNDVPFKLKPVIIESLVIVILYFSDYRRKNYFLELSSRFVIGPKILKSAPIRRGLSLSLIMFLLVAHIAGVIYSGLFLSVPAWGYISSILLFVLLVAFIAHGYYVENSIRRKMKYHEIVPVVNGNGVVTGMEDREKLHFNPDNKLLHPVVHLHVFNRQGELYLQKRHKSKRIQPDKWDTAVGGHVGWGELLEESLIRETFEEIGLKDFNPTYRGSYIWETVAEKELVFLFTTITNSTLRFNPDEISEARFWSLEEIDANMGKGIFTPNFEHEMRLMEDPGFRLH